MIYYHWRMKFYIFKIIRTHKNYDWLPTLRFVIKLFYWHSNKCVKTKIFSEKKIRQRYRSRAFCLIFFIICWIRSFFSDFGHLCAHKLYNWYVPSPSNINLDFRFHRKHPQFTMHYNIVIASAIMMMIIILLLHDYMSSDRDPQALLHLCYNEAINYGVSGSNQTINESTI